jgi:hypothetical protein
MTTPKNHHPKAPHRPITPQITGHSTGQSTAGQHAGGKPQPSPMNHPTWEELLGKR